MKKTLVLLAACVMLGCSGPGAGLEEGLEGDVELRQSALSYQSPYSTAVLAVVGKRNGTAYLVYQKKSDYSCTWYTLGTSGGLTGHVSASLTSNDDGAVTVGSGGFGMNCGGSWTTFTEVTYNGYWISFNGGLGNDWMNANGSNTALYGEGMSDTLVAMYSGNVLEGGDGDDTLVATASSNTLRGQDGNDCIEAPNYQLVFDCGSASGYTNDRYFYLNTNHTGCDVPVAKYTCLSY